MKTSTSAIRHPDIYGISPPMKVPLDFWMRFELVTIAKAIPTILFSKKR
jgi:hypothetical protein